MTIDKPPFTPRNVAKFVATGFVQVKTAALTREAIADHTSLDSTSIPVYLGSNVVGWYVAEKVKPYTDLAVDKTADFINDKREARKARKSEKTETEK